MSLALYRKYRPRTFAEVIGQEHVTEPLSQALRSGRLNHAYLFSGPRGCGKTSSARILARSLNCEQGPTPEPCGVCMSCKSLMNDGAGSIDVIEIDAASHGGVDDARELREKAFFAPASSRFKIYVIDEAHMVSSAGFNALLKLVEEPPDYVKFIFATTEPEKVLATIRSRTHHYPFRLIPPAILRPYLQQLTEAEGIHVDPAVFPLVVKSGGGSARDTLSVLDQLIAGAGPDGVSYSRAVALLGVTDATLLDEICDALAAGDGAAAYGTIDRVAEAGHDPRRFASDLLERLRDLIVLQQVPDAVAKGLIDGPADQLEAMAAQAGSLGQATLSRCADIVHNGLVEMRGTTAPRLLLELITARMLLPGADDSTGALLQRLERMESQLHTTPFSVRPENSPTPSVPSPEAPATDLSPSAAPVATPVAPMAAGGGLAAARAAAAAAAAASGRATSRPTSSAPVSPAPMSVAPVSAAPAPVTSPPGSAAPVRPIPAEVETEVEAELEADVEPEVEAEPAAPQPVVESVTAEPVPETVAGPDWNGVADGFPPDEPDFDEDPGWEEDSDSAMPAPPVNASAPDRTAEIREGWPKVVDALLDQSKVTGRLFAGATVSTVDGDTVVLAFDSPALAARASQSLPLVAGTVGVTFGGQWQVRCEGDGGGSAGQQAGQQSRQPVRERPRNEPSRAASARQTPPETQRAQPGVQQAARAPQTRRSSAEAPPSDDDSPAPAFRPNPSVPQASAPLAVAEDGWPEPARPGGGVALTPTEDSADGDEWPEVRAIGGGGIASPPGNAAANIPPTAPAGAQGSDAVVHEAMDSATAGITPQGISAANGADPQKADGGLQAAAPRAPEPSPAAAPRAPEPSPAAAPRAPQPSAASEQAARPAAAPAPVAARTASPGSGLAAARAAARAAANAVPGKSAGAKPAAAKAAAPAAGQSAPGWSDAPPPPEAPYDPEYDGPPPGGFDGFDPGDEPLDEVIDEKTARESGVQQAMRLLQEAFGAEKIGES